MSRRHGALGGGTHRKQMIRISSPMFAKFLGGFVLNIDRFGSSIHFCSPKLRIRAHESCVRPFVCALVLFANTVISARAAQDQPRPYKYTGKIPFDLKSVPFSRFGSYLKHRSEEHTSELQSPMYL